MNSEKHEPLSDNLNPLDELKHYKMEINAFISDLQQEVKRLEEEIDKMHGRKHSVKLEPEFWKLAIEDFRKMKAFFVGYYHRADAAIQSKEKK